MSKKILMAFTMETYSCCTISQNFSLNMAMSLPIERFKLGLFRFNGQLYRFA